MIRNPLTQKLDELGELLGRWTELKREQRWPEVVKAVGRELAILLNVPLKSLAKLTELEMVGLLASRGPSWSVEYKKVALIALLAEAGICADTLAPPHGGYGWYVKALHLLLESILRKEIIEYPGVSVSVDLLLQYIGTSSLPLRTQLLLCRVHEERGELCEALKLFHKIQQTRPKNMKVLRITLAFLERVKNLPLAMLKAGNVSLEELDEDLRDVRRKISNLESS